MPQRIKMTIQKFEKFTLSRNNQTVNLAGTELYAAKSALFGCDIDIHATDKYGNIMFLDGEAQISSVDYELYHKTMMDFIPEDSKHLLVVGDGDGGFTSYGKQIDITQIEPCADTRKAAEIAYDVDWTNVALIEATLATYLKEVKDDKTYDAIFLAITDEFNQEEQNFEDVLQLWTSKLKKGGVLVCQVGCEQDPNMPIYLHHYESLLAKLQQTSTVEVLTKNPYIEVYHSTHLFMAFYKD